MKSYPSISRKIEDKSVIVFDKLDGSNIRAEWSKKKGFYKFGSRTQLIDSSHPLLGEAVNLIANKQDQLSTIFKDMKCERVVSFFEFYGDNSFAGSHEREDHTVTLLDVDVYKRGIIPPQEFVDLFTDVGIPTVLHTGVLTESMITSIRDGSLPGMTFEGVVCKHHKHKNKIVKMFKVKNRKWIEKLRDKCDGNDALFRKLV